MEAGLSPLDVLLPRGRAGRALVLGSGCPPSLRPVASSEGPAPVDLVVVAPDADEAGRARWIAEAIATAAERLAPDGLVYVLVPRSSRASARRALRAHGLTAEASMLHLPDAAQSRLLVPLEAGPARLAFTRITPLARWKQALAGALLAIGGSRLIAAVRGDVGMVARRAGARQLLAWLPLPGANALEARRSAVVSRSPRAGGARLVVHVFADGSPAPFVAKLRPPGSAEEESERSRLERIGASAARAGALVPSVIQVVNVDGAEFTLETRIGGDIVAPLLIRDASRLEDGLGRVCDWLREWGALTATPTQVDARLLEREILAPARVVAPAIEGGAEYLVQLETRCADLEGRVVPLTASHNDLSMWNVLLDGERVGVIDWESAEDASLPLKDFYYAAVDAVVAAGHGSRHDAVAACFGKNGRHAALIRGLEADLIEAAGASPQTVELSFHACWLKHAAYEARKHAGSQAKPFREVVQWLAAGGFPAGA